MSKYSSLSRQVCGKMPEHMLKKKISPHNVGRTDRPPAEADNSDQCIQWIDGAICWTRGVTTQTQIHT